MGGWNANVRGVGSIGMSPICANTGDQNCEDVQDFMSFS